MIDKQEPIVFLGSLRLVYGYDLIGLDVGYGERWVGIADEVRRRWGSHFRHKGLDEVLDGVYKVSIEYIAAADLGGDGDE